MSLADLLNGDMDDDDDDDDDESYVADGDGDGDGDSDDDDDAAAADLPAWRFVRLHPLVNRGDDAELERVLESGRGLEGPSADHFIERVNRPDSTGATPLHAAISSAAIAATVKAAGPKDPWAPDSVRRVQLLLGSGDSDLPDDSDEELAAAVAADDAAAGGTAAAADGGGGGSGGGSGGAAAEWGSGWAEGEGQLRCLRLLLSSGASVERKYFGRTALHLAAAVAGLEAAASFAAAAAAALLDAGADLCAVDGDGQTPLHLAAVAGTGSGGASVLQAILDTAAAAAAAAVRRADLSGRTPLHAAIRAGGPGGSAAALALLRARADPSAAEHAGSTALHLACAAGDSEVVRALLAGGASSSARDGFGRSAAGVAARCGFVDVVAMLLSEGTAEHAAEAAAAGEAAAKAAAASGAEARATALYAHPACLLHTAPVGREYDALSPAEARRLYGQPECAERLRTMLAPYGSLRAARFAPLLRRVAPRAQLADVLRAAQCRISRRLGACEGRVVGMPRRRVHEFSYYDALRRQCAGLAEQSEAEPAKPAIGRVDTDTEVTAHSLVAALHAAGGAVQAVADVCASPRRARNAFCAVRPPGHHAGPRGAVGGQSAGFCLLSTAAIGAAYALACRREVVRRVAILDYDVHHGNGTQECVRNVRPTERVESFSAAGATLRLSRVECKPWLSEEDGDNVFFGSIHGFGEEGGGGGQFYPGSGGPVDQSAEPSVINSPVGLRTPSAQWRRFMSEKLLTPLAAFGPDLVIISAGFDAHAHDPLEAGALLDSDFEWMTAELVGLAERCCDGRLVSLLEGGYQTAGGPLASLGRAAAAHVAALMDPTLVGVPWDARACGERLESGIAAAAEWRAARATAATSAAAAPAETQEDGSSRRSKRSRTDVDYTALQAEIEAEEGGGA